MKNPTFKFFYFVNPKKYINFKDKVNFFSIKTFKIIHGQICNFIGAILK
jgi:hypothetical protein